MKCKFEHDGDCCNSGAKQYMCKCQKPCDAIIPKTNADRIRSMSDEELRNWLFDRDCTNIAAFLVHGGMGVMDAVQLLDWLQHPAE